MSNEQRSLPPTIIDLYGSMRSYSGRPSFLMGSFACNYKQTDLKIYEPCDRFLLSWN